MIPVWSFGGVNTCNLTLASCMPIIKAHPVSPMGFQSKVEQVFVYMVTYDGNVLYVLYFY